MTEQFTEPQQFTTPLFKEGPLPDPDQLEPDEALKVHSTLLALPSWNELDRNQTLALVEVDDPNFAHLFNGESWNFQGSQRLSARTKENYPAWVLLSNEFRHGRVPTMRMLDHLKHIMGTEQGIVYIAEKASEDKEVAKRLRILEEAGFVDPQIHFNESYTLWEGKNKTDQTQESPSRPDLEFQTVYEMAIPLEVKRSKLIAQRPNGDVLYVDQRDPDTATIVNPDTWQPVLKKGRHQRLTVSKIVGRNIAAIVYHTPPRTPERAFDEDLANAASLLKRTQEKDEGIIKAHHQGALFIVEDKGEDTIKKWREQMMNNIGLVMNVGEKEEAEKLKIVETDQYIITAGRREKKQGPTNLLQSKNGPYFAHQLASRVAGLRKQGFEVDDSRLKAEAQRSSVPPSTMGRIKDARNTKVMDPVTGSIIDQSPRGTFESRASNDDYAKPTIEQVKKMTEPVKKERPPQPGDVKVLESMCGDCGEHLKERYFSKPGEYAMLLIKQVECDGSAHRRGPVIISNDFVRSLGKYR